MRRHFLFLIAMLGPMLAAAHLAPNSILVADVRQKRVDMEVHLPVTELQLAVPFQIGSRIGENEKLLENYIRSHLKFSSSNGKTWHVSVRRLEMREVGNKAIGITKEIVAYLQLAPPETGDTRHFTISYDAIMHKVVNHRALVYIRQDWQTGQVTENHKQIGVIGVNTETMKIEPLVVNLDDGSGWQGFSAMVELGLHHIAEGTDHLMFLLVLLLTAPLFAQNKKWRTQPSLSQSIWKILKISLSFTIGHSVTLLLATLGFVHVPSKPVEILIAFSILVTAFHAIRPLFARKETWVAAGFGLVHGLAFSTVLADMHLESGQLAISLLGFNLGIECMQLVVVFLVMPWLLYLSRFPLYTGLRIFLALFAGTLALVWMLERFSGNANFVSKYSNAISAHAIVLVVLLFLLSAACFLFVGKNKTENRFP